eukprot:TRINITY_DN6661_c0_g1_i1.p1 TRINITY_DN6661_c0_g1~~TRINITY_DN6661_c0_g1_i1.p1  ORF type:complete len:215 (+),score=39.48 TRINITY_DN6661_c0_g1_i1:110-754(+)
MGILSSKTKKKSEPAASANRRSGSIKQEIIAGKTYKLVMLGDGGVGKTAVTIRFVNDRFVTEYDPTVEDAYKKNHEIDGKQITVDITDTAGQEEYTSGLQDKFIREGEGFILVFSIVSKNSFLRIKEIRDKITWTKDSEEVPILILGNKADLASKREVTTQEARDLAMSWGCPYLETSAKTGDNINECIRGVLMEIVKFTASNSAAESSASGKR